MKKLLYLLLIIPIFAFASDFKVNDHPIETDDDFKVIENKKDFFKAKNTDDKTELIIKKVKKANKNIEKKSVIEKYIKKEDGIYMVKLIANKKSLSDDDVEDFNEFLESFKDNGVIGEIEKNIETVEKNNDNEKKNKWTKTEIVLAGVVLLLLVIIIVSKIFKK